MADPSKACGDLRERITVLTLTETDDGYAWTALRRTWANVQPDAGQNLFSKLGTGAPGVRMVLRRQPLTRGSLLLWRGRYVYISDVRPYGLGHVQLAGALVTLANCTGIPGRDAPEFRFPAVLAEKYVRHEQMDPYAVNALTYVLVTPPQIQLQRGSLVTVDLFLYEVLLAHVLDPCQVEYALMRKVDL